MSTIRSLQLRRSLALFALLLISFPILSAQEFSYKGIRLGMSIDEFRDSMTANPYFREPTNIRDYFGNDQDGLDSMTHEVIFYQQDFPVGYKTVAGDTRAVSYDRFYVTFLKSRIVDIRLFYSTSFIDDLVAMSAEGLVSKLGKASIDNRNKWKDGYGDAEAGKRESVVRWNKKSGKDSTFVGVGFVRSSKDTYSETFNKFYPVYEVTMFAVLKSPELDAWYAAELKDEVDRQWEEKYGTKTEVDF